MDEFYDASGLQNEKIRLRLNRCVPANPVRGYVGAYEFDICAIDTDEVYGGINFRLGMNQWLYYSGNVGYTIYEDYRGNRYAAQACRLLLPLAKKHGMQKIIITCNPENIASSRTCQLAGGTFVEIVEVPVWHELYQRGEKKKCIYQIEL